jgi:hypothetical protein
MSKQNAGDYICRWTEKDGRKDWARVEEKDLPKFRAWIKKEGSQLDSVRKT